MLKAMESGAGSISTTHAPSAEGAIGKLVTCAMEAGPHVTHDYAVRAIAAAIDVVVHVHLETTPTPDGTPQRHRWVARDHHRHPRGAREGVRDPARVPHRTRASAKPPRTSSTTPTGTWPGGASTSTGSTPPPGGPRHDTPAARAGRRPRRRRHHRRGRRAPPGPAEGTRPHQAPARGGAADVRVPADPDAAARRAPVQACSWRC